MNYYPHQASDFDPKVKRSKLPMVYVIATTDMQYIKIGSSRSFKQRLSNIQSGCPFDVTLLLSMRTPKHKEIELFLHKTMIDCRLRGEWFKPSGADLDFLADYFVRTNQHIAEVFNALL